MFQLFTRDARRLQRSRILEERGCACHDLPSAPGRQHHVRKLALWSFCLHSHLSLFLGPCQKFLHSPAAPPARAAERPHDPLPLPPPPPPGLRPPAIILIPAGPPNFI